MGDYNLTGLNSRDFEHIVQALAKKYIASGVMPFGDGPDGGREATFEGKMDYPSKNAPWDGYLVIQCKFRKKPIGDSTKDGQWVVDELTDELDKYIKSDNQRRRPEYFIFVTNITLTAVSETGSKDKALDILKTYKPRLGLKGYDIWSYDELCRFIDDCEDIRSTYYGFVTTGDVLEQMKDYMTLQRPDFDKVMRAFLQKELLHDKAARLESAGQNPEQQTYLSKVFIDLPVTENKETSNSEQSQMYFLNTVLEMGARKNNGCDIQNRIETDQVVVPLQATDKAQINYALVGGPGQGKSTLAQYLCQIYRAAILKDINPSYMTQQTKDTIELIKVERMAEPFGLPTIRRFPVHIILSEFASIIAKEKELTLVEYIRRRITILGSTECSLEDIKQWLELYPWLVVFDGLDEVPVTSNRKALLTKIQDFIVDTANVKADVQIIATTRPQSYNDDFAILGFTHLYLTPLSTQQALKYGKRLAEVRSGDDERRKENILRRLKTACQIKESAHLMKSPLQVTIMTTLVERIGEPPRQRYRLFEEYYDTIYAREIGREGPLSAILSERKTDIDNIHYRCGLLLQSESEKSNTEARLSNDDFRALVRKRLIEVGELNENDDLLDKIADSALDRLVFLVRPNAETVAFEIRSLQEFMAAEALLLGKDKNVEARLEKLAPISHWRNVYLFAVGKCFAEKEHLLDTIDVICRKLNDNNFAISAEKTLWGSRLALDILADGMAKQNLTYERLLVKTALLLTNIPDSQINTNLSQVYHDKLDDLFKVACEEALNNSNSLEPIGAWALVTALADKKISWALTMIEKRWPTNVDLQKKILLLNRKGQIEEWRLQKLKEILPKSDPLDCRDIYINDPSIKSDWLHFASNVLSTHAPTSSKCTVNITDSEYKLYSFDILFLSLKRSSLFEKIENMPFENKGWAPYFSHMRFSKNPSHITLANELNWLAENWDLTRGRLIRYDFLWPLGACLSTVPTKKELLVLAEKAKKGELGKYGNWLKAEERWKEYGITYNDFTVMNDSVWPFDKEIENRGFPFACCAGSVNGFNREGAWNELFIIYKIAENSNMKSWLAWHLLNNLRSFFYSPSEKAIIMTPDLFKGMLTAAWRIAKIFNNDVLNSIQFPVKLDEDWIAFFDWLGQQKVTWCLFHNKYPYSEQLANWYSAQPEKYPNLIASLGRFALLGNKIRIEKEIMEKHLKSKDESKRLHAMEICLSQDNWCEKEVSDYAKILAEDLQKHPKSEIIVLTLEMLKKQGITSNRIELFAMKLLDALKQIEKDCSSEIEQILFVLKEIMNGRNSGLSEKSEWSRLKLPEIR